MRNLSLSTSRALSRSFIVSIILDSINSGHLVSQCCTWNWENNSPENQADRNILFITYTCQVWYVLTTINNSKLFGPYLSLCFITACFTKCNSDKGKNLPTLFWPHAYINILVDVSAAFSLSIAYISLEADWKHTTCFKGSAGSWQKRGENATFEFTCLCQQSCTRTVLPAQQPWERVVKIQADTAMPTNP